MRQHGYPTLLVNCRRRFSNGHPFGNRLRHPQRQDVPPNRRHFHTGDDVERILSALFVSPQTGVEHVVIGNRNHVKTAATRYAIKNLLRGGNAIAGTGMYVHVRAA